ncbi:unnamed protein product, partial [Polarella glacialis]
ASGARGLANQQPSEGNSSEPSSVGRLMRQGCFSHEAEERRERQVAALEKQLMVLNSERQVLKGTLMKFPPNSAGKTLADRRQKLEAEQRLEVVGRTISELRISLRSAMTD